MIENSQATGRQVFKTEVSFNLTLYSQNFIFPVSQINIYIALILKQSVSSAQRLMNRASELRAS